MEAIAAVGEAFFSAMFEEIRDSLKASDLMTFAQNKKVHIELTNWKDKFERIKAVHADAEEKQAIDRSVKIWLQELRDLSYDIQDILDEFEYEALRCNTAQPRRSTGKVIKKFFPTRLRWSGVAFNVKMGSRIKEITKRLQEISTQKTNLGLGENVGGKAYKARDHQRLPTTSISTEVKVFGRNNEKEAILKLLLVEKSGDEAQVPVINITGMAGIGKTTLAQLVYNDDKVNGFFDLKAWIYVSEDFDVVNVTKAILHAVKPGMAITNDLNLLHLELKEQLSGKKFLLVLDDVWHPNDYDWSLLISPFEVGTSKCKIIITTRNQNISQITGLLLPAYPLKELAYGDCLSILADHALGSKNFDGHPHLKETGKELLEKCKGLPLAVKALASLLRNKRAYKEWEAVSKSKMWDLTEEKGGILATLRLGYRHLPSHLKPCFAYCSLIPKGYEFDRDELVLLWIAEGFVQQEDLGRKYFNDLRSRSFFQKSNNKKSLFVMHDLHIDLAQSVARDLCLNMENESQTDDGQHNFEKARHVSFIPHQYDVSQRFEILNKMKRVRSFLALRKGYCYLSCKVLQELLPKLKCLRVLSLSGYSIGELPNSIGGLKLLRCLNLSKTAIRLLPESVGNLHHLQMLILSHCKELTALRVEICGLSKLHRLDIIDTPKLKEMPPGLGNLTSLRVLPKFIIGKADGQALRELKDLSLQGQLSIIGLHNVEDIQDARIANLKQKHGLKKLALEWSEDRQHRDNQMRLLESLHPPKDLQQLSISYYGATKFPSWVWNPSFAKIEQLELFDCINCESLPSLGRLPLLRNLNIRGMHAVTSLGPEFYGDGFPVLEILKFENMRKWEEWISSAGDIEGFPLLRELILHDCPKLVGKLPRNLPLVKLDVQNCPRLTNSPLSFSRLGELTIRDSSKVILRSTVGQNSITKLKIEGISGLTCLTEELIKAFMKLEVLEIEGCSELTFLWRNGSELENLPWLKSLVIKNCPKLESLVGEKQDRGLCCLSSLEDLRIESCQKFVSLPATGLPYTLKYLTILECKALESLPDMFGMNGCNTLNCLLEELEIVGCPSLKSFPKGKLPLKLKRLRIKNCRNLGCLPDGIVRRDHNENSASHLEYLCVADFPALESIPESWLPLPNLKVLRISNCMNLTALPNQMQNFKSLQELSLSDCEALTSIPDGGLPPNVTSLEFCHCKQLMQPISEWGLDRLYSLTEIKIVGTCPATDMVSFPDDEGVVLPPTLTNLSLESLQNLESLSPGLQNLTALQQLHIKDCCKLRFLPKKGLPDSLGRLCITGCPGLQKKCRKERKEYWSIICDIPCLEID